MSVTAGHVRINSENDIVTARKTVRDAASELRFSITDVTRVVTAASELARNVFLYAGSGVMRWSVIERNAVRGLELKFEDEGPGIEDIDFALRPGCSTGHGLGLGLSGAKRLMDELDIQSQVGQGTTVTVRKWLRD